MSVVEKIQQIIWDYIRFSLDNIKKRFFFIIFLLSSSKLLLRGLTSDFPSPRPKPYVQRRANIMKCNIPIGISLHWISFPWSCVAVRQAPLYKNL